MSANDDPAVQGPNSWLIDEMFGHYQEDPESVPEEWRATFEARAASGNGDVEAVAARRCRTAPVAAPPVPQAPTSPTPSAAPPYRSPPCAAPPPPHRRASPVAPDDGNTSSAAPTESDRRHSRPTVATSRPKNRVNRCVGWPLAS